MEIVVRTPHGDADVSIVAHDRADTLGDVIRAVTGQAVPRLALVDGHAVDCATPLDDVGLLMGSVVTTEPTLPGPTAAGDVDLLQIAGHGAGRVVHLGPGRYRIGPGRRTTAAELDQAPVERAEVELVVEPATNATVVPIGSNVALDGTAITAPSSWSDEILIVGSRAFLLEPSPDRAQAAPDRVLTSRSSTAATARPVVGPHGTVTFSRPPRGRSEPTRRPVVDAVRTSTTTAPTLWERRSDHADAFSLPFGVRAEASGVTTATIDVAGERAVAISGSERFRSALARTLVIEAVTLHGPADLDVVVLTSSDDVAEWDWVKWLPHARLDGPSAIWCSDHDIARWGERAGATPAPADAAWIAAHLTMVVLDDPALWTRRDSPLRAVVANPPDHLRLLALCDDIRDAPSICTAAISESADGLAHLHSFTRDADIDGIRPSLVETAVAVRVARSLAALVDVDLPTAPAGSTEPDETVGLQDLVGVADVDELLARWNADRPVATVTVGRREVQGVEVSATDDVTVVVGSTMGDAFDVAATSILAQCAHRSPDGLWVVPLMMVDTPRSEVLWQLPHATPRESATSPIDAGRLLARLRAVLDDPSGPDRILVVAEHSGHSPASLDEALLRALVDGARSTPGLGVMMITDRGGGPAPEADTLIRVERQVWSDTDGGRRRAATVITGDGSTSSPFRPFDPSPSSSRALELRPYVIGRPLTPLERRVEHEHARASSAPDPVIEQFVSWLQDAAATWERTSTANERLGGATPRPIRRVIPPAMPTRVDLDELFRTSPGDGVPLGLVDDPGTGGLRPRWWQPGDGSMLVFGSRRSGVEQVLSTVVLGVIDRFAPDDVRLVVIDPSPARRRALNSVGHGLHVVAPDQVRELTGALDEIEAELDRQADAGAEPRADGPRLVVLISDLAQLRQQGPDAALTTRLDAALAAAANGGGVDVIAYAGDLAGVGPFAMAAQHRVVGITSERSELAALGVDDASDLEGTVGRCRSFPGGDLVQLAMPDAVIETMLARRSGGGPS